MTRYAFEEFELDTELCELRHRGGTIPVRPPLLDALGYLIAHRNRIVTREELLARVWPDGGPAAAGSGSRPAWKPETLGGQPDLEMIGAAETQVVWLAATVQERATDDQAPIPLRGWSSPELEGELSRARDLAAAESDPGRLATVLRWLATVYEHRGEHGRSQALLEEDLALRQQTAVSVPGTGTSSVAGSGFAGAAALVESLELLASSVFHQGQFERALRLAEEGLALDSPPCPSPLAVAQGKDPKAACHGWAALALWFLGHPDQASNQAATALETARQPERSHGLPFAEAQVTCLYQLRREPEAVRRLAAATLRTAGEGPPNLLAASAVLDGWAGVFRSDRAREIARGLARIEAGVAAYRETGEVIGLAYLLGVHADALQRAGQLDEALARIEEARRTTSSSRPTFWHAELDRLEGCLYLEQGDGQRGETSLQHARELARRQRALTIELRTACCLARLLDSRGDTRGARRILSEVYGRFEEGHRTPDLREAAALLETL